MLKAKLIFGLIVILLAGYVSSWFFLPELRLAGPMANMAYFYYRVPHQTKPKAHTKIDRALYFAYFPLYWTEVKLYGLSRYGIHWSDRKDIDPNRLKKSPH